MYLYKVPMRQQQQSQNRKKQPTNLPKTVSTSFARILFLTTVKIEGGWGGGTSGGVWQVCLPAFRDPLPLIYILLSVVNSTPHIVHVFTNVDFNQSLIINFCHC